MSGVPKVNPAILQQEYITSDISYRSLAVKHGLDFSTIAQRGRKEGWPAKRDAYKDSLVRQTYEATASRKGQQKAAIYEGLIDAGREYVKVFMADLEAGKIKTDAKGLVAVASMLLQVMGEPTSRTETTIMEWNGRASLDNLDLDNLEGFLREQIAKQPTVVVSRPSLRLASEVTGTEG